ncbi:SCO family protein [Pseudohongiella spirulinae]|uniref:Thioredoxin domain-containing protein n=1 Tax=Pseudohongiella spirulinae TaxID=1249552 RepID=A0A0S2KBX6_9GAMM|nr:SCO family protein [Pseudohongiella spirulinae]ALO45816.1 hypothetical protein PS2015_1156 [Pseudohongiella spirulinae]
MNRLLFGVLVIVALGAGIVANTVFRGPDSGVSRVAETAVPEVGGLVLRDARELPPFELLDINGDIFRETDFAGDWSFLYFGFTYCPDICPTSLVEMEKLKQRLGESHPELTPQFYLVSVDPLRDTPERLREYVSFFDPEFRGLTGEMAEIDKFADAAAVVYQLPSDAQAGGDYEVGHSSTIVVIDPAGDVRAILTPPLRAANLASDFAAIEAWWVSHN